MRCWTKLCRSTSEPLVANQCEYHPRLDQSAVLAACKKYGLAFVSYSPLGKGGLLAEPAIAGIAQRLNRKPSQIVLRWHLQQGVAAIPRSGSPDHIADNFGVFDFSLTDDDMAAISGLRRRDGRMVDTGLGQVGRLIPFDSQGKPTCSS